MKADDPANDYRSAPGPDAVGADSGDAVGVPVLRMKLRWRRMAALLSLSLLLFSPAPVPAATTLYTQTDELACGDTRVKVFTTCADDDIEGTPECTKQYFLFTDRRTGTELKVKASGKPSSYPIEPGSKTKILDGSAWRWGCVRGKADLYVMIDYGTGGNCETCEWVDILDLSGRKVLTDRSDKDRRTDREVRGFRKKWKALGLPDRWPVDSFVQIKIKKTDR